MRLAGIDAELMDLRGLERFVPELDARRPRRFPIVGALVQRRGGTVRHDAVAWGYARAASALGVDIIEDCEVTGVRDHAGTPSPASRPAAAWCAPSASCSRPPATPA